MDRLKKRKVPNKKRTVILLVLLVVIVYLLFNVDSFIEALFPAK